MATTSQKIAVSTVAQIMGRFIQAALGLASVALLTRYLGLNGYGEYSTVFAYTGLAAVIADFGTTTLIIREATQKRAPIGDLIGSGVAVSVIIGALTSTAFAAVTMFMPYSATIKGGILVALIAVFIGNLNVYGSFFSIRTRLDMMVLVETAGRAITVGILAAAILAHLPFLWIIAITPLGAAINAIFGTLLVLRSGIKLRADSALIRFILKHSLPIGLISILGLIQYRFDAVILSVMRPAADVAIYTLASKILDIVVMVPTFFLAATYPALSAAYTADADFRAKSRLIFNYLLIIGLPVAVGAFLIAPSIAKILGSAELSAAALPLQILCGSALLGYVTSYFGNIALIAGLQRQMLWRSAVVVAFNVAANVALIPIYSYNGAAAAAVATSLLALVLGLLLLRGRTAIGLDLRLLAKTILATALMSAAVIAVRSYGLVAAVASGAIVYLIVILATRAIQPVDIRKIIPSRNN